MSARPSVLRPLPAIANVGHLFLVVRAIGEADRAKAARLVEAARPCIGLEAPKLEGGDAGGLGDVDQKRARPRPNARRMRVKQTNFLPVARQKRHDTVFAFRDS